MQTTHNAAGFKRIHRIPRAVSKGATLQSLTPRGASLRKRSEERYLKRDDAYGLTAPLVAEIGSVEHIRFIASTLASTLSDARTPSRDFVDAFTYGMSAYRIGLDPGGEDFTVTTVPYLTFTGSGS